MFTFITCMDVEVISELSAVSLKWTLEEPQFSTLLHEPHITQPEVATKNPVIHSVKQLSQTNCLFFMVQ